MKTEGSIVRLNFVSFLETREKQWKQELIKFIRAQEWDKTSTQAALQFSRMDSDKAESIHTIFANGM